jgi:hypothetical protein
MMKCFPVWLAVAVLGGLASSVCFALVITASEGTWPDSWPKELEALRGQARTVDVAHGIQETVYEIPFKNREAFEAAWPHILSLKSVGAPLILAKSPSAYGVSGTTAQAGVRILCPVGGGLPGLSNAWPDADFPWTAPIAPARETLPEYVTMENGVPIPATPGDGKMAFYRRARVDIELIVDGNVVDLNRVPLPQDAPIIDRRFPAAALVEVAE